MMETVHVRFLRGTSLGNGNDANPGDVVDLDRRLFAQFAQQGRCVEVTREVSAEVARAAAAYGSLSEFDESAPVKRKGKKNA